MNRIYKINIFFVFTARFARDAKTAEEKDIFFSVDPGGIGPEFHRGEKDRNKRLSLQDDTANYPCHVSEFKWQTLFNAARPDFLIFKQSHWKIISKPISAVSGAPG